MVDAGISPIAAAAAAALVVGFGAALVAERLRAARVTLTVPAVLIMIPGAAAYRAENMEGLTWPAMQAATADPEIAARVSFYEHRAPEELYDLVADPDCLVNLADRADADLVAGYRDRLLAHLEAVGDPLGESFAAFSVAHG